jgi:hypothetical protein
METSLMSEPLVDTFDVEETVTHVLTQLVQDGVVKLNTFSGRFQP